MDVHDSQDVRTNLERIHALLACGIFSPDQARHPLQQSAFIELMICLRDVLHKCEQYSHRVEFTDDIMANEYVTDVTDAVTAVRDACCHFDTHKRHLGSPGVRGAYLVGFGRVNIASIGSLQLRSEYEDDVAFFYGSNRLYLNRHIRRALNEAEEALRPLLDAARDTLRPPSPRA